MGASSINAAIILKGYRHTSKQTKMQGVVAAHLKAAASKRPNTKVIKVLPIGIEPMYMKIRCLVSNRYRLTLSPSMQARLDWPDPRKT